MDEKNETDIDEMIITNDIIQDIINNIIYEIENDHPLIRRSKFDDDKIESPTLIVLFGIFLVYIYYIGASLFWTKCYTIPTLANVNSCDMQLALSSSILMLLSGGIYTSLRERKRALKFMFVYEAFYKETMTNSTRRKDRKKISRLSVIEQRAQMVERNSQV